MYLESHYRESTNYLRERLGGFEPEVLLILGSGLGFMADEVSESISVPYADIPHFKTSTAPGHKGCLLAGRLSGRNVLVMQGRFHIYEGYSAAEVAYPIRIAHLLGAKTLITTNACGGVNTGYQVGDLALLTDYIKFADPNPVIGMPIEAFGNRFFDMSHTFDSDYQKLAACVAKEQGITLRNGVYFYMTGPQFETPAEIRAIRVLGGDLVGMSTVPECIMARRCGMRILGISLVTNMAAGVLDQPITEEEVLVEAQKASVRFANLILTFLKRMDTTNQ